MLGKTYLLNTYYRITRMFVLRASNICKLCNVKHLAASVEGALIRNGRLLFCLLQTLAHQQLFMLFLAAATALSF